MSSFDNLFNMTPTGELSLNKKELKFQPLFQKLLKDMTKSENIRDLGYIYLMADPKSLYSHLEEQERNDNSIKFVGYNDNWKPTLAHKEAIEFYAKSVNLTPTGKSFSAANKALFEIGQDLNDMMSDIAYFKGMVKKKMNIIKERETRNETEEADQINLIKDVKALYTEILGIQKDATRMVNELPKLIKTVEDLAYKWANEGETKKEIWGGGELNNREE